MLGFVAELLPRFRRYQQEREDAQRIAEIIVATGEVPDDVSADKRPLLGSTLDAPE